MEEPVATTSYAYLFLNSVLAQAQPIAILTLLLLFFARMLPIIGLAPFFGARVLPHTTKMAFALTLFVLFIPKLLTTMTSAPVFSMRFLMLGIKEMIIGFIMGYIISIPFNVVSSAGMIIDHQRGGASLMVNDPTIQNQSSPLGTIFNLVLIYIFYLIDGPFLFIDSILLSYDIIPVDQFINPRFFDEGSKFWDYLLQLFNTIMVLTIQLASPALIAILMTDMFLGIANRLAPQVQITFLGLPLKSLLGLTVVTIGFKLFTNQMGRESLAWIQSLNEILYSFKNPFAP